MGLPEWIINWAAYAAHNKLKNLLWSKAGHTIDEDLDLATHKAINVVDPVSAQDAATKKYHDDYSTMKTDAKARAYLAAAQNNIPFDTITLVNLDTENYDVGSNFNTTTHQFTTPIIGYYFITGGIGYTQVTADKRYSVLIYVNGVRKSTATNHAATTRNIHLRVSDILYVTAGQTIDLRAWHDVAAGDVDLIAGDSYTFLAVHLLSI